MARLSVVKSDEFNEECIARAPDNNGVHVRFERQYFVLQNDTFVSEHTRRMLPLRVLTEAGLSARRRKLARVEHFTHRCFICGGSLYLQTMPKIVLSRGRRCGERKSHLHDWPSSTAECRGCIPKEIQCRHADGRHAGRYRLMYGRQQLPLDKFRCAVEAFRLHMYSDTARLPLQRQA